MNRLYKSRKNKVIAGVCGGIGEYFDVDPVLVRLIAVVFLFTGGAALLAYFLGMVIMPKQPLEGSDETSQPSAQAESQGHAASLVIGIILIVCGAHFLLRNIPFFHSYYWWFWDMGWHFFWPSVLIAVGLLVILGGARR